VKSIFLLLVVSVTVLMPLEAPADGNLSSQMAQVLQNAKILKQNSYLRVTLVDKQAVVLTERAPKAADRDCKIDALLMAKTLMGSFPEEVHRVKILFNNAGSASASQVDVSIGDVRAFENKLVNADQLLDSIELKEAAGAEADSPGENVAASATVVPGPYLDKRLILLGQIEQLKSKGTGVKIFEDLFRKIEDEAASGDKTKLTGDIQFLSDKLTEQEQLIRQAAQVEKEKATATPESYINSQSQRPMRKFKYPPFNNRNNLPFRLPQKQQLRQQ
jgi:hypothetical protein